MYDMSEFNKKNLVYIYEWTDLYIYARYIMQS